MTLSVEAYPLLVISIVKPLLHSCDPGERWTPTEGVVI